MVKPLLYTTSDTGLAAFLVVSDIKLCKLITSINPAEFIFEQDGKANIDDLKFQWETGIAKGNVSAFYKAYRGFTRQIREENKRRKL